MHSGTPGDKQRQWSSCIFTYSAITVIYFSRCGPSSDLTVSTCTIQQADEAAHLRCRADQGQSSILTLSDFERSVESCQQVLSHGPSRKGFYRIEASGLNLVLVWIERDILYEKAFKCFFLPPIDHFVMWNDSFRNAITFHLLKMVVSGLLEELTSSADMTGHVFMWSAWEIVCQQ